MSIELPIAPSERAHSAVLRIALPAFGRTKHKFDPPAAVDPGPSREEFQQILQIALRPDDLTHSRLTRAERRQLAATRRVRQALYGSEGLA